MASTNITTFPGKVGVSNANPTHTLSIGSNVFVDDTGTNKLVVLGSISTTGTLSGDGSGISNIQSSNVSDFASNVTRIGTLETVLGSNVTRIENLESGDITITGTKTFQDDVILESNLRVQGDLLVANTVNMTVSDPILELGSNNLNTGDIGLVMTRHGASNSNVAVFFDETADTLKLGYTLNGAGDSTLEFDSNALAVSVQGALTAASVSGDGSGLTSLNASNVSSGTLTRPISTTTGTFSGNVGIGTTNPVSILHVRGTGQTSTTSFDTSQTLGASIFVQSSDSVPGSGGSLVLGTYQGKFAAIKAGILNGTNNTMGNLHFMTRNATTDATLTNRMTITNTGNVGIGTTSPSSKLHIDNGVLVVEDTPETRTTLLLPDGDGTGGSLNEHFIGNTHIGVAQFVSEQEANTSTIAIINKDRDNNTTKNASIGFYNTDTVGTGKYAGRIGFWPTNGNAQTNEFRVYTTNTVTSGAGYDYPQQRFVINKDGNVGIGTTIPRTYLHLSAKNSDPGATEGDFVGTHNLTEYLRFTSTGDSGDVNSVSVGFKLGDDDISDANPNGRLDICANRGSDVDNDYGTIPDETIATFLGSGNVGIGTASPRTTLEVYGSIMGSTNSTLYSHNLYYDTQWKYAQADYGGAYMRMLDSEVQFWNAPNNNASANSVATVTQRVTIKENGNVGIGTASPARPLTIESSSFDGIRVKRTTAGGGSAMEFINGDGDEWTVGVGGTGTFGIYDGATFGEQFTIDTSGNVGIGTTAPGYTLDVHGTSNVGALTATSISGPLSGNASTATALETARNINGVSFNGSANITVNGLNYNVNNGWLREQGDNANFRQYGNTRQMAFRTDGTTEYASGVGGYPFVWMYGGDAASNRRMLLNSSGQLWCSDYGWLHDKFVSRNSATAQTFTDNDSNANFTGHTIDFNGSGTQVNTVNRTHRAFLLDYDTSASGGTATSGQRNYHYAMNSDMRHSGTGNQYVFYNHYLYTRSDHTSGTCNNMKGVDNIVVSSGTGLNPTIWGINTYVLKDGGSTGATSTIYGNKTEVEVGAGTVTNAYAYHAHIDRDAGTLTTGYLYYGNYAGTVGTKWGVYITGESKNYFSGNVGIGTTSPTYNLDVNGSFGAKNKGWYITGGGGNAGYNGASPNKNYFAYNVNNTVYGSSVTTYNGASSSAWRSNDGVFTYPEAGLYQVTIHMFINGTSNDRYGVFKLNDSGGTNRFSQYMYFTPSNYGSNYQRSWTTFVRVESGWQSYMQPEGGSITLYLADQHTCLLIDKIC